MKLENKEIIAGVCLTFLLLGCLLFAHAKAVLEKEESAFVLFAPFNQSDGLMNGAEVRVAGIKVGRVVDQTLNEHYQVVVKMEFFKPLEISTDSSVIIETDGLLGSKYLEILPGGEEEFCKSGDELEYTQDALILSDLMDKVNAFMRAKKEKEKEQKVEAQSVNADLELNESESIE